MNEITRKPELDLIDVRKRSSARKLESTTFEKNGYSGDWVGLVAQLFQKADAGSVNSDADEQILRVLGIVGDCNTDVMTVAGVAKAT